MCYVDAEKLASKGSIELNNTLSVHVRLNDVSDPSVSVPFSSLSSLSFGKSILSLFDHWLC